MRSEVKRFDAFVSDLQQISERNGIWLQVVGGVVFSENVNFRYCNLDHTSGDLPFEEVKHDV